MPTLIYTNNAVSSLAGPISSTVTSIVLQAGTGAEYPNPSPGQYFTITMIPASSGIPGEIMYCTARSGDTLTVLRGQEGTSPTAYAAGDNVSCQVTAGGLGTFAQVTLYAGNPNGNVAGWAGSSGSIPSVPSLVWDTVDAVLWICTVSGTSSTAQWTTVAPSLIVGTVTYYVNPVTGSDSNNGLSSGTAWATLTHAYRWLQQNINANGQQVIIDCAFPNNPTPYAPFVATGGITGIFSPGQLMIVGDNTSQHCSISLTAGNGVCVNGNSGALFEITGFSLQSTGSDVVGIAGSAGSQITYGDIAFGSFGAYGVVGSGSGSIVSSVFNTTLTAIGTCISMFNANELATMHLDVATVNNSLTVSGGYISISDGALVTVDSSTFGGSGVTGSRFNISMNGMMDTNGAQSTPSTNYIPGTTDGTTATGGQFR